MLLSTKILIFLGIMLTFGMASFIIYKQVENSNRLQAIEGSVVQQKQLVDGITRSLSEFSTKKDIDQFLKDSGVNLKAIQDDLAKLHGEISAVNVAQASSTAYKETNVKSTSTTVNNTQASVPTVTCDGKQIPCPNADPFGYQRATQNLVLNEEFGQLKVPFGQVSFDASQQAPWSLDVSQRQYNMDTVIGADENRKTYVYNKFSIKTGDKNYDVPIANSTTKQEYPTAKFSFWNPRLFIGVDGGIDVTKIKGEISPTLSVGFMSYGQYKKLPDFSVLEVGIGYGTVSQTGQVIITPATYNIGKHIPLMDNTYIGPSLGIGFTGGVTAGVGIRVGL